jgi:hypothetical protein
MVPEGASHGPREGISWSPRGHLMVPEGASHGPRETITCPLGGGGWWGLWRERRLVEIRPSMNLREVALV